MAQRPRKRQRPDEADDTHKHASGASGAGGGAGAGASTVSAAASSSASSSSATAAAAAAATASDGTDSTPKSMIVQFQTMKGEHTGPQLELPLDVTPAQLEQIVNTLLESEEPTPYAFYVSEEEVTGNLVDTIQSKGVSTETVLPILYQPLSTFRVVPVTRCTDTVPGHTDAVLHVSFSPDGTRFASGGGDCTVRFYDAYTSTPKKTCTGHRHHVLCTAWNPTGTLFASGDKLGEIRVWNPKTGKEACPPMKGHRQWITSIAWEPMHSNKACNRFASSSKDHTVRVWNVTSRKMEFSLTGHTSSVECVKWGGEGLLYTASRDRTVKVWAADSKGKLVRSLMGHAHRVNHLALSTDYVCRTGPFDPASREEAPKDPEAAFQLAKKRYAAAAEQGTERLVSASDDFTMFLWNPTVDKKSVARMTGHQQPVNHISFSPDGRFVASASFDKKVKLWDGRSGKFIATLTGHVGAVYQVCWSSDSRLLASASKDSTVKIWKVSDPKHAKTTLGGHADEVYALDWSPDGERLASGSKDRLIKIWRN